MTNPIEKLCQIFLSLCFIPPRPHLPLPSPISLSTTLRPHPDSHPFILPQELRCQSIFAGCRGESLTPPLLPLALSDHTLACQSRTSVVSIGWAMLPWYVSVGACVCVCGGTGQCHSSNYKYRLKWWCWLESDNERITQGYEAFVRTGQCSSHVTNQIQTSMLMSNLTDWLQWQSNIVMMDKDGLIIKRIKVGYRTSIFSWYWTNVSRREPKAGTECSAYTVLYSFFN